MDARDLLRVWETGSGCRQLDRALVVLAAHRPDAARADLAGASVGRRNRGLLEFRRALLGRRLSCVVECPECGTRLALELDTDELLASADSVDAVSALELDAGAFHVEYRLLTSDDLEAVAGSASQAEARLGLIRRCVVSATRQRGGTEDRAVAGRQRLDRRKPVPPGALPARVIEELADALAESDPLVEIRLRVTCADCGHESRPTFDVGAFLWSELSTLAHHALEDVHTLASAYGWAESDILAMSPFRRQAYLDRVGRD